MAKTIYSTQEKYRRPEVIALLSLFSGLLIFKVIGSFLAYNNSLSNFDFLMLAGIIVSGWILVLSLKMGVRISKNTLKVKYNSIFSISSKFKKKDVDYIEFIDIPETAMWNGMSVHFESAYKAHGLGDNSGLKITMNSGENIYIYSNSIYQNKNSLTHKLNAAGWEVRD